MQYYFDESGDWSRSEHRRLVLGGLCLKTPNAYRELETNFDILKARYRLNYLHATEMSDEAREDCYRIILQCLKTNGKAMIRIYPPAILHRATQKRKEDIYSELAAELVGTLILGDAKPSVNYDMKFHYAYPKNIILNISVPKPYHYQRIIKAHELKEDQYKGEYERVAERIQALQGTNNSRILQFVQELGNGSRQAVSDYLWSELILQIQGKETAREIFRQNILNYLKSASQYGAPHLDPSALSIQYFAKNQNNAGIEAIDILCNLIYHKGKNPKDLNSNTLIDLYKLMLIEEIR